MYVSTQGFISPNEVNQSIVRTSNTVLILIYVSIYAYINTGFVLTSYTYPAIGYFIITCFLYIWSVRCVNLPHNSKQRISFRIIGLTGDIVILSLVMHLANEGGTPLFFLYLWITVANGIRYGMWYLIISASLSILCFAIVTYETTAWQTKELIPIAIGLFISLLILPTYILSLISRLSLALEAERAANKVKQTFLANMNHELRTPLNSILNLAELIGTYKLPAKIYGMLDMIRTSANDQLQIVNGILDVSRIEAGQYKLDEKKFDLYSLVHKIKQSISPQADKKKIKFFMYISPSCQQYLVGAEDQIKQILINLVGNAVKFTDEGFVRVSIDATPVDVDKQVLTIKVEDSGIGIATQFQKEIFKPFVQADTSITRKYGGTGLGITISDEFARMMKGEILLESTPGIGTIFTFRVPLSVYFSDDDFSLTKIKLCLLNVSEKYTSVLKSYTSRGIEIITTPSMHYLSLVNCVDERTILIMGGNQSEQTDNNEYIIDAQKDRVIIEALDHKNDNVSNLNAITSINTELSERDLLNAIKICATFLPINLGPLNRLPKISRSFNILLAEDDQVSGSIQKIIFSKANQNVTIVQNGRDALSMLRKNKYDVAILDLHMPSLTGVEVARDYMQDEMEEPTKLILLTADVNNFQLSPDIRAMFSLVMVKPSGPAKLLSEINNLFTSASEVMSSDFHYQFNSEEDDKNVFPYAFIKIDTILENISVIGQDKFKELLLVYDAEVRGELEAIANIVLTHKPDDYYKTLHQLKGASMAIGAMMFGTVMSYMANLAINSSNMPIINALLAQATPLHKLSMLAYEIHFGDNFIVDKFSKIV